MCVTQVLPVLFSHFWCYFGCWDAEKNKNEVNMEKESKIKCLCDGIPMLMINVLAYAVKGILYRKISLWQFLKMFMKLLAPASESSTKKVCKIRIGQNRHNSLTSLGFCSQWGFVEHLPFVLFWLYVRHQLVRIPPIFTHLLKTVASPDFDALDNREIKGIAPTMPPI